MKRFHISKIVITGISILLLSILALVVNFNANDNVIADEISKDILVKEEKMSDDVIQEFYIDVKGAVKKPGVYKVESGMIVADALRLAGGVTSKANTNNINLSRKLSSEMVIYVYTKNEISKLYTKNEVPCKCETIEINTCIDSNESDNDNSNIDSIKNGKVNINTASKEELLTITGIGEKKADAIIEYRSEQEFETIEDIKNISGIGDAIFDKIKDHITV